MTAKHFNNSLENKPMITIRNMALVFALALTIPTAVQPQGHPACQNASSDSDGDGWGWENNGTCKVYASTPVESSPTTGSACSTAANQIVNRITAGNLSAAQVQSLIADIAALPFICSG